MKDYTMIETINLARAQYPTLDDRLVVIVGGTGDVGEGITRAWLKTGARVVVLSRTEDKITAFRQVVSDLGEPENLYYMTGSYTNFDEAQATAKQIIAKYGSVTDVIASMGGWWQGKLLWEISKDDWQRYFVDLTTAHVTTVHAWVPHLPSFGTYQLILGGSAVEPVKGASIINMQQAALLMMRKVLSAELGDRPRVLAQILGPVVTRARQSYKSDWVSNQEVGLVSTGIAADSSATNKDYISYNKTQMLETLKSLGVYPK